MFNFSRYRVLRREHGVRGVGEHQGAGLEPPGAGDQQLPAPTSHGGHQR